MPESCYPERVPHASRKTARRPIEPHRAFKLAARLALSVILQRFGNVTGLYTNFAKSYVVPIRCRNIDLDAVLEGVPATRASFPLRYLGLPLSVWCLRRRDFQLLKDKCAGKLPTWNGKYVTLAGDMSPTYL
jgi:hypothetical protein